MPQPNLVSRRRRGGSTTKLHALVLNDRMPLILTLTPGHWGDAPGGRWRLEQLGPQTGQPQLLGDRAYEGDQMRALAAQLGWELVAPPRATWLRPWPVDREAYRARNAVERYSGRLKRMRGIATRYHKLARGYLNQILLACIHFMTKWSEQALDQERSDHLVQSPNTDWVESNLSSWR